MKGFIFAAGLGSRLQPITDKRSKVLLPIGGARIIEYSLNILKKYEEVLNLDGIGINLHHHGQSIQKNLGDTFNDIPLTYSVEEELLGTGGGLKAMRDFIGNEPIVVLNGDVIADFNLEEALLRHKESNAKVTMFVRASPKAQEYGAIGIDANGRIVSIRDKGKRGEAKEFKMFCGAHIIDPSVLDYIPPGINSCIVNYAYVKALQNDEKIMSIDHDGYWYDIGTPSMFLAAQNRCLNKDFSSEHFDPLAGYEFAPQKEVDNVIRLGKNVTLSPKAILNEPVLIGDNVIIGDDTVIGPNVVIEESIKIPKGISLKDCTLLKGALLSKNEHIDSMLIGPKQRLDLHSNRPLSNVKVIDEA